MTIDQDVLDAMPDHGAGVLARVARLLGTSAVPAGRRDHAMFAEGPGALLDR